ncbi:MAG: hypothetical protein H7A34_06500 [bacterium]|nr:hypothetical protein [bacterium]
MSLIATVTAQGQLLEVKVSGYKARTKPPVGNKKTDQRIFRPEPSPASETCVPAGYLAREISGVYHAYLWAEIPVATTSKRIYEAFLCGN